MVVAIGAKEAAICALLCALPVLPAWAGEFGVAASDGLAGAGVARSWGAGVQNSAAMSILPGFAGHTDVRWFDGGWSAGGVAMETLVEGRSGVWSGVRRTSMNQVVEGDDSPGWLVEGETLSSRATSYTAGFGTGFSVVPDRLGVGLSGSYERVDSDLQGVEKDFNLHGSIAGRLGDSWSVVGAVRSFLPGSDEALWAEVGAWWDEGKNIGVGLDGSWRENWFGVRAGTEVRVGGELVLRGGYSIERNEHLVGLGLGTMNPSGRIDYGLQWVPFGADKGALVHTIGATFNLFQLQ